MRFGGRDSGAGGRLSCSCRCAATLARVEVFFALEAKAVRAFAVAVAEEKMSV